MQNKYYLTHFLKSHKIYHIFRYLCEHKQCTEFPLKSFYTKLNCKNEKPNCELFLAAPFDWSSQHNQLIQKYACKSWGVIGDLYKLFIQKKWETEKETKSN